MLIQDDIDLNFVNNAEEATNIWIVFAIAHRSDVSDNTMRAIMTCAIKRGMISMYVGSRRGQAVWSYYVQSLCIKEFFRNCYIFKERPRDMPTEFIIGRTNIGNPIKIVINGEFTKPML